MGDHQPIAHADEANHRLRSAAGVGQLFGDGSFFASTDERVAADCDQSSFRHKGAVRFFAFSSSLFAIRPDARIALCLPPVQKRKARSEQRVFCRAGGWQAPRYGFAYCCLPSAICAAGSILLPKRLAPGYSLNPLLSAPVCSSDQRPSTTSSERRRANSGFPLTSPTPTPARGTFRVPAFASTSSVPPGWPSAHAAGFLPAGRQTNVANRSRHP